MVVMMIFFDQDGEDGERLYLEKSSDHSTSFKLFYDFILFKSIVIAPNHE